MSRSIDGRVASRGTALVDSRSPLFLEIMSDMLADCGFAATSPAAGELPWLSVMRSQPAIVICDGSDVSKTIRYMIVEVLTRRIPLLMAIAPEHREALAQGLALPDDVVCFDFPITLVAFRSMIDGLIPSAPPAVVDVSASGFSVEAAVITRPLDAVQCQESRVPFRVQGIIPDRPRGRWIKLLP